MKPETEIEKAILENEIGMFAICSESENGFLYWIAGLYKGGDVPEGLELYSFPASDWAIFTAKGPMPGSLQTLNTAVWQEWFPNEGQKFQANGKATLEVYSQGDPQASDYECGIWIPVQKMYEKAGFVNSGEQRLYAENTGMTEFLYYEKIPKEN